MMGGRGHPSMAEKRENSVLFSLREIRQIEEDERARIAAEQRRAREEEERRRREIAEAERARLDAEEARRREEELRLEESERKARVEAQARLEEQKLRMEIEARAREASTRKAKILVAATAVAFVIVAVTGVFAYRALKEREAAAAAAAAQQRINEENGRKFAEFQARIDQELASSRQLDEDNAKLLDKINAAKDADERRRYNEMIAANNRAKAEAAARVQKMKEDQAKLPVSHSKKCENSTDPLCQ